ncbi:MAG: UDP-3-O-acyl-N-acetylglucosamine deacetylase [Parvibaculum sp.]|nr:UDP-3-O-acyl-N-acetylglucosamine deacetylase [Parvibaculum sp.]
MFQVRKSEFETIMLETVRRQRRAAALAYPQMTLAVPVVIEGAGLHSGKTIRMTLRPADADHGVVFRRIDLEGGRDATDIRARHDHVVDTTMSTVIGNAAGARVGTIEHLMAALSGLRIDNALIEIDGAEVPVLDGSAEVFIERIEVAGLMALDAPRRAIRILKPVIIEDGAKRAALLPGDGFRLAFEIDFDNPVIGRQAIEADLYDPCFADDILHARTFGFLKDQEALKAAGLGQGASLDNAIVIDGENILNEEGLRYEDEFVRHKVLDAVGDLSLSGLPLLGRYEGARSGHAMNNRVLRALMADETAWEVTDFVETSASMYAAERGLSALTAD